MFTGIVEATGRVRDIVEGRTTRRIRLEAPELAPELAEGDSIAVDGACLTVVERDERSFCVDVIGTTLGRTVAGGYVAGRRVNLERAMLMGARIDGHLVQGHVDGIGRLVRKVDEGEFWLMDFELPSGVASVTVERGSIALNGVSLTVSALLPDDRCRIGVIPYTCEHTNLGELEVGAAVNVEGDQIGKYVERILGQRGA